MKDYVAVTDNPDLSTVTAGESVANTNIPVDVQPDDDSVIFDYGGYGGMEYDYMDDGDDDYDYGDSYDYGDYGEPAPRREKRMVDERRERRRHRHRVENLPRREHDWRNGRGNGRGEWRVERRGGGRGMGIGDGVGHGRRSHQWLMRRPEVARAPRLRRLGDWLEQRDRARGDDGNRGSRFARLL